MIRTNELKELSDDKRETGKNVFDHIIASDRADSVRIIAEIEAKAIPIPIPNEPRPFFHAGHRQRRHAPIIAAMPASRSTSGGTFAILIHARGSTTGIMHTTMFTRLKRLFSRKNAAVVYRNDAGPDDEPPTFTILSLWNNFEKRTWHYERYKAALKKNDPRLLNWIGSIDYSGYTREHCLLYLIEHYVPGDENRILLRLVDWVPKIQAIARKWVLRNFEDLPFDAIHANDRMILYLLRKQRLVGDPAMEWIADCLLAKTRSIRKHELFLVTATFRRYLYTLSLDHDQALRPWLLDDREPFNRLLILTHSECHPLSSDEMDRLSQDKSVFVRRRYLTWRIEKGIQPTREELVGFAFDKNRSLRELARFYLRRYYEVDAYELYTAKEGPRFYYIADYAKMEDVPHFLAGMKSESKEVRLRCLRAICQADYQQLRGLDLPALLGENRKIRGLVCLYLPRLLSVAELLSLRGLFQGLSSNGVLAYLHVLRKKSYWHFVHEALAELADLPTPAILNYICLTISSKVAVYEKLSGDLRNSIEKRISALRSVEDHQLGEILRLLEFTMRTA